VLAFLAKLGIGSIVSRLAAAYEAKQRAETDRDKLAADERIKVLEAKRDVLVREAAHGGLASWVRPLFALPFVVFTWKVVVWDVVLQQGTTDPLSPHMTDIMMVVIGGYFLSRTAEKVTRIVRRK